jgi:hypothetical protein
MAAQAAYEYLEKLQEEVYGVLGRPPERLTREFLLEQSRRLMTSRFPDASPAELQSLVDGVMAEIDRDYERTPTRFESPTWYSVMRTLVSWIEGSARQLELPLASSPAFGTLPTGRVNAMTVAIPDSSDHVVLFEDQLFLFALLLSKALARAFPVTPGDEPGLHFSTDLQTIQRRIDEDPSVVGRFADVVLAYAVHGRPGAAQQYLPEPAYAQLSDILRESMEAFVLGHEYGHVVAGHLTGAQAVSRALAADEVDEIDFAWDQEYEADTLGVLLSLTAMNRERQVDASLSFWGADLFFSAMDVMDRAVSLLRYGDETLTVLGTHPPSPNRRAVIRAALHQFLEPEQARAAVQLADALQATTEMLWARTRGYVVAASQRGATADPRWLPASER